MSRIACFCLAVLLCTVAACNSAKKSASTNPNRAAEQHKLSMPVSRPAAEQPTAIGLEPGASDPQKGLVFVQSPRLSLVLEKAQKEKKVVFLVFEAVWCAPCRVMEEEVFTQVPTYTYLNSNFINYKVDFDTPHGASVASIYEVKTLPTVLFLNPQGVVLERKTGMATHSILTMLGDSALRQMRK